MTAVWELPTVRAGMEEQGEALRRLEAQGATLIGWKVGVGAPAAMKTAGIPAPLVGYLTSQTVLDDRAAVSLDGWVRPVLEPEIAIVLGADVGADASPAEVADAIAAIAPAIELADVDTPLSELTPLVGGNIFHRAVILGSADSGRSGGLVDDLRVTVQRGSAVAAQSDDVTATTGSPPDLVAHVAAWLAAAGRRLEAGQVIIGGSVVPIIPVEPGDAVTYRCEPLGTLGVSFT